MRYFSKLLVVFLSIVLYFCLPISDVSANKLATEKELKAVVSIMKASKDQRFEDVLRIMKREKISMKRLKSILVEIAMVMPYIQTELVFKSIDTKKLKEAEKEKLEFAKQRAKKYALEFFKKMRAFKAAEEVQFEERFQLYMKYGALLEPYMEFRLNECSSFAEFFDQ